MEQTYFSTPIFETDAPSRKVKVEKVEVFSRRSVHQSGAGIDGPNAPFSSEDLAALF
jgi:hypothetical protein